MNPANSPRPPSLAPPPSGSGFRTSGLGFRTSDFRLRAFTLVEIVIALTIVAILTAAAIPSFQGFRDEQMAREPVSALVRMAKEARLRAMQERRPYQIAFYAGGFTASRYFNPYLQLEELNEFLASAEAGLTGIRDDGFADEPDDAPPSGRPTTALALAPPPPKVDNQWNETYELPTDTFYTLQFWHELQPTPIEGDLVKLWVFQPTGICQPLTIEFNRETVTFHIEFSALTADITREIINLK
jgi:prepilin-type N-terminal cleavage/methylation domain-containing protein